MTEIELSLYAGAVLSLLMAYVPGLSGWYNGLAGDYKRLAMAGLLLLVAGGAYALACGGLAADIGLAVTCDRAGAIALIRAYVVALVGNQAAYQIAVRGR